MVPVRWMAPETLKFTSALKFSVASDIWSFGVTLWEIYTFGELPYHQFNNQDVRMKIVNGVTLDIPERCPKSLNQIMKQCWKLNPEDRCSFQDIVSVLTVVHDDNIGPVAESNDSNDSSKDSLNTIIQILPYGVQNQSCKVPDWKKIN